MCTILTFFWWLALAPGVVSHYLIVWRCCCCQQLFRWCWFNFLQQAAHMARLSRGPWRSTWQTRRGLLRPYLSSSTTRLRAPLPPLHPLHAPSPAQRDKTALQQWAAATCKTLSDAHSLYTLVLPMVSCQSCFMLEWQVVTNLQMHNYNTWDMRLNVQVPIPLSAPPPRAQLPPLPPPAVP